MAAKDGSGRPRRPPARTPQDRENQLIALAYDESERIIREGRATSQLLTHFLKLGTDRERLERERLDGEVELLRAKRDSLNKQGLMEGLMQEALTAMRTYTGRGEDADYID
jgi:hypothetical protein